MEGRRILGPVAAGSTPVAPTTPPLARPLHLIPGMSTIETPAGRALANPPAVAVVALVSSSTRDGTQHAVTRAVVGSAEVWGCSCESGRFRPDRACRHLRAVREGAANDGTVALTPEGFVILGRV